MENVRIYQTEEGYVIPTTERNVVLMEAPYYKQIPKFITEDREIPDQRLVKWVGYPMHNFAVLMDASNILLYRKNLKNKSGWFEYVHPINYQEKFFSKIKTSWSTDPIPKNTKIAISGILENKIGYRHCPILSDTLNTNKNTDHYPKVINMETVSFSDYERFIVRANQSNQEANKRLEKFNEMAKARRALFEIEEQIQIKSEFEKELKNMPSLEELLKEKEKIKLFD